MSALLGFGGGAIYTACWPALGPGYGQNKDIIDAPYHRRSMAGVYGAWPEPTPDARWPRSSFPSGAKTGGVFDAAHQTWEWNTPPTGSHVLKVVSGTVYDTSNNPVSGVTIWLFNTATGALVDTQVTAADGSYSCGDPNAVACFAVAYKAGSPDIAGVSLDTVTGT